MSLINYYRLNEPHGKTWEEFCTFHMDLQVLTNLFFSCLKIVQMNRMRNHSILDDCLCRYMSLTVTKNNKQIHLRITTK